VADGPAESGKRLFVGQQVDAFIEVTSSR